MMFFKKKNLKFLKIKELKQKILMELDALYQVQ